MLLDDKDKQNIVDEDNHAHSNAPNDSYQQSTITAEVCSRLSVGGDDAARAARSARSLTDRAARTRRCSNGEVAAARSLLLLLLLRCCKAASLRLTTDDDAAARSRCCSTTLLTLSN